MKVTVRLGEPLWRQIGERETEIELPEPARVGDLVSHLAARFPDLRPWLDGDEVPPTVFLGEAVADPETLLHDGDRPLLAWALAGG
jgi:molybdopterin converting factor small subunit